MKRLVYITDRIADIFGYFCKWLVPIMVVLTFAEVFSRYVAGKPLVIADEYGAYMLVTLSFLGAAYAWKEKSHVRITFLVSRLPLRAAIHLRLATLIVSFIFLALLTHASYGFMATSFRLGLKSSTWLITPMQVPHLTVAIGFLLLSLLLIGKIAKAIMQIRARVNDEETDR